MAGLRLRLRFPSAEAENVVFCVPPSAARVEHVVHAIAARYLPHAPANLRLCLGDPASPLPPSEPILSALRDLDIV